MIGKQLRQLRTGRLIPSPLRVSSPRLTGIHRPKLSQYSIQLPRQTALTWGAYRILLNSSKTLTILVGLLVGLSFPAAFSRHWFRPPCAQCCCGPHQAPPNTWPKTLRGRAVSKDLPSHTSIQPNKCLKATVCVTLCNKNTPSRSSHSEKSGALADVPTTRHVAPVDIALDAGILKSSGSFGPPDQPSAPNSHN